MERIPAANETGRRTRPVSRTTSNQVRELYPETMRTDTRHVDLLDAIGLSIVSGEIKPGESLTLRGVQEKYNTSRTVARECMRVLESAHMVTARRRLGIVVRPAEEWNAYDRNIIRWRLSTHERTAQLRQLTELRLGIEPLAAALAAFRLTEEEAWQLRKKAAELKIYAEMGEPDKYRESDIAFHSIILRATRNYMYSELAAPISEAIFAQPLREVHEAFPAAEAVDLHYETMLAVCSGESEQAEELMRHILKDVHTGLGSLNGQNSGLDFDAGT